jgi:hypothetical protein
MCEAFFATIWHCTENLPNQKDLIFKAWGLQTLKLVFSTDK